MTNSDGFEVKYTYGHGGERSIHVRGDEVKWACEWCDTEEERKNALGEMLINMIDEDFQQNVLPGADNESEFISWAMKVQGLAMNNNTDSRESALIRAAAAEDQAEKFLDIIRRQEHELQTLREQLRNAGQALIEIQQRRSSKAGEFTESLR